MDENIRFSLKELRARNDETQKDISDILGVSESTYRAWEKDPARITLGNARILANHFNISVSSLKI